MVLSLLACFIYRGLQGSKDRLEWRVDQERKENVGLQDQLVP